MDDLVGVSRDASLRHQLAEAQENLRLLEEREAEYVLHTDVPPQLIKEKRRLCKCIADLKKQLKESVESTETDRQLQAHLTIVRTNQALLADLRQNRLLVPYLREATNAGLDMNQLPNDSLGALLESIVRQIIERDRRRLLHEREHVIAAHKLCRLLSYLGWYMCNEGVTSCDATTTAVVVGEILIEMQMGQYDIEQVLDWLVGTYWLQQTVYDTFEFRDPYFINVFAAIELKERFSTVRDSAALGLGPGGNPAGWQKTTVFLAGVLRQGQAIQLLEILLEAGLVQLAGWCMAEGQPIPHHLVARVTHALLAQLTEVRQQ